jgi:hypothetical protein
VREQRVLAVVCARILPDQVDVALPRLQIFVIVSTGAIENATNGVSAA